MAIEKVYILKIDHYDYFGGQKNYVYKFDNLHDAFMQYKENLKHDFIYSDAYRSTRPLFSVFQYKAEPQRWHARSEWEWKEIVKKNEHKHDYFNFSAEEIEYLTSLCEDDDPFNGAF